MRKRLVLFGVTAFLLLTGLVIGFLQWMGKPLYSPGSVRKQQQLGSSLEPPAQEAGAGAAGFLTVAPDIRLFHFAQGQGPTVLVLHGGPGFPAHSPWPGLAPLSDRWRFVYFHQRGCGASTRPVHAFTGGSYFQNVLELDRRLGLAEQIADVERIRRILREEKLLLVGHSYGAFLASLYAAEFPERVKGLLLVAPSDWVVLPQKDGGMLKQVRHLLPRQRRTAYDDFLRRYFDYGSIFARTEHELAELNRELLPFLAEAAQKRGWTIPVDSLAAGDNAGWMVHATYFSMGRSHNFAGALAKVRAPVLIVHGGQDIQSERASRRYQSYFPQARFEVIAGAGHFPFSGETSAAFSALAASFLGSR